jgi:hypothetical protein
VRAYIPLVLVPASLELDFDDYDIALNGLDDGVLDHGSIWKELPYQASSDPSPFLGDVGLGVSREELAMDLCMVEEVVRGNVIEVDDVDASLGAGSASDRDRVGALPDRIDHQDKLLLCVCALDEKSCGVVLRCRDRLAHLLLEDVCLYPYP